MTISHPKGAAVAAIGDVAFVFAELGGFTCSICAPSYWDVGKVIDFAEERYPSTGARWVSVDKSTLGFGSATPNPCNEHPKARKHWFMMRGET